MTDALQMLSPTPYYAQYYLQPTFLPTAKTWLDYRHPEWRQNWLSWVYARDVYAGAVLQPDKIGSYLIRKGTGETLESYFERQALADFTSFFGACADALAGMMFHGEDDATRVFGALGAADDPSSTVGHLMRDADGEQTGYATLWKQLAIDLIISHEMWVLQDMFSGSPRIKTLAPERVVDWLSDETGLVWVKVCEATQTRSSWQEESKQEERYVVYRRDGWTRYRQGGTTDKPTVEKVDEGTYRYEDASGQLQLPICRVRLPLKRNVGFPMAKKNIAIFNKESERDHLLRTANFPKLIVPASDEVFKVIEKQVQLGSIMLQDDPHSSKTIHFDAPPVGSVDIATRVLEQKALQYFKTFFREYSDASIAKEKTATQVRQDTNSGAGAFLQMLKAGLDDAENQVLWRLEQSMFPNDRTKWNQARVERSDNFSPLNVDEEIERLRIRYFGQTGTVPLGREAAIEVLRQIAEWDGLPFDEDEAQDALDNQHLVDTAPVLSPFFALPPEAKAKLTVKWLERLGVVDPADVEAVMAQAMKAAKDEAAQKAMLAQPFGPPQDTPTPAPASKRLRIKVDPKTGEKIAVQE
jgi:hypothetical protein